MKYTINETTTVKEYLSKQSGFSTMNKVRDLVKFGTLFCNNTRVKTLNLLLNPGDTLEIKTKEEKNKIEFGSILINILYEDENLIAVEKPVGIVTSIYKEQNEVSLYKIVEKYLRNKPKHREKIFLLHRLDREVSGIVLFAKDAETQEFLKNNWQTIEKYYHALVEGCPIKNTDTIKTYMIEDADYKMKVTAETPNAKLAITHYEVINKGEKYSLLKVKLETGRKNQIRVQLSSIGNPIVGDRKYGGDGKYIRRIRLHATDLSFVHPRTGQKIHINSKLPSYFLKIRDIDEKY